MRSSSLKVRLTKEEIEKIKTAILSVDPEAEIVLFGSRTDLNKKGGDIDLLVVSSKIDYKDRRKIRVNLFKELGDRKIDLIVTSNPSINVFTKYSTLKKT
ncbi:DNA polymerase beta domain protein region [Desulfurobacterium thermolithotrophum DSM 11699]|uniref:DNA polymerase beta domain protein region n=1 Tax=Desulfurobacterium thermolithotrophum (strain DSM 11699 / BSA) TaxID=868864 RepID=F0S1I5_DESTD|nr:nucleotidyltransferase domain-containing protein [Desulfurobacterium thermolithotrophum]ADY73988.1 DNA polymerase beta domain protein region [Desulfurobacterium thermolithotrophum DSM 11699]